MSEALTFLQAVYGEEPPLPLSVFLLPSRVTHWPDSLPRAATIALQAASRGQNVYVPVGLQRERTEDGRGTADTVGALAGLWADVDYKSPAHKADSLPPTEAAALSLLEELPLPPTVLVHSGHGLQAWWLFRELWVFDSDAERRDAATLSARWQATIQAKARAHRWQVDNTADLARVLRLPGTVNRKPDCEPAPVRLLRLDDDNRYTLDDFEPYLADAPANRGNGRDPDAPAREVSIIRELQAAAAALGKLSSARCDDYIEWLRVGMALSELGQAGLELWDDWSRQSAKYKPGVCAAKWGTFEPGHGVTLASLIHWAREDSPPAEPAADTATPTPENLTDLGNARRMVRLFGKRLRFCHPWGRWLVWDGKRWAPDDTAAVERAAKQTVASIYADASACPEEDRRKELARYALRSEAAGKIKAMMELARSEPGIPVLPDALDSDPWLLTVNNGTLDLRTGQLRPHDPADLITRLAPVDYDPTAACPRWLRFLSETFAGNDELISYVQRLAGYALTGDVSEQALFVLWGSGQNGKSTLLSTLGALLGDYWRQTPTETLLVRSGSTIPNDVAALRGARLVTAIEADEGRRLAESLVKQMTGGDALSARFMRAEWFQFVPEFKLFLATNHKPEIRGTDHAIWRRIRLIPFRVRVPEEKQDKRLGDKLQGELSGILAWAVRGCQAWQREGMAPPADVVAATSEYREEMDPLADFLVECCIELPGVATDASALYRAYAEWCERQGQKPINQMRFGLGLVERGFSKDRNSATRRIQYHGLGLRAPDSETPGLSETLRKGFSA